MKSGGNMKLFRPSTATGKWDVYYSGSEQGDRSGRAGNGYSHVDAVAGAGAKRTYGGGSGRGRSAGGGGHARASIQSLGSGASAIRKYACDANASWETVHMSVRLRRKATVSGISNCTKGQNGN
eukprot:6190946-Pleurochrysis_carterae.AAC.1